MFTAFIVRRFADKNQLCGWQNTAPPLGNTQNGDGMRYSGKIKKNCALMVFGGTAYGLIEILWRGKTHWSMLLTGGFCFTMLNAIYKKCTHMLLVKKCLLGGAVITICEFFCGVIVNIKLKLNVWDYSHLKFNIKGQICLLYSVLWSLLCLPVCAICKLINRKDFVKEN